MFLLLDDDGETAEGVRSCSGELLSLEAEVEAMGRGVVDAGDRAAGDAAFLKLSDGDECVADSAMMLMSARFERGVYCVVGFW